MVIKMRKGWLLLVGIFLFSLILRLYHLPSNFVFGVDEEFYAYSAQTIIRNFHIVWVGGPSTADFYLGPFWVYLTSFLLWVSRGDPLFTGYVAIFIGSFTAIAIYLIGKNLFGKSVGLVSSILYAALPLMVFYDQKYWNVSAIPLLSLICFWSLAKLRTNPKWLVLFALAYGLVFHAHLSLVFYGPLAFFWLLISRTKIKAKTFLVSIIVFLVTYSPLLIFDYFHNWSNLLTPVRLWQKVSSVGGGMSVADKTSVLIQNMGRVLWLTTGKNSADETNWGCGYARSQSPAPIIFIAVGLVICFICSRKTWKEKEPSLLALIMVFYLLMFLVFPGGAYEYYLLGFFPLWLLSIGVLYKRFKGFSRWLFWGGIVVLTIHGIMVVSMAKGEYGLLVKKTIIKRVMETVGHEPFVLSSEGKCHIAEGWRYLFSVYGRKPNRSSTDQIFGWLYADEISQAVTENEVMIVETRTEPVSRSDDSFEEGGFRIYFFKSNPK